MNICEESRVKKEMKSHLKNKDYGLYRNCVYRIGQNAWIKGDYKKATSFLLKCAYLDLNGPNNTGGKELRQTFKELGKRELYETFYFNPDSHGSVAPAILGFLSEGISDHGYTLPEFEKIFLGQAKEVRKNVSTPVEPIVAWRELKSEINKYLKY